MRFSTLATLATSFAAAQGQTAGFNYGSTFTNGAAKQQSDFEAEFTRAQNLQGATCFSSARLYTCIQAGTANTPISAIPAAISTRTSLMLGLWASAGQDIFNNEVQALQAAIQQYGSDLVDLIVGISVGSEDLYRITPTGIENNSGVGASPDTLVSYIGQVRDALSGTAASGVPIGHVDTWTAWVNGSNSAVVSACDWLGHNGFPYFETTLQNSIDNGEQLFNNALGATRGASQGKPVYVTETGWPVSGPLSGEAVASVENAKTYWDEVACGILGTVNTWWYTLQDAAPDTPSPSFGIVGSDLNSAPTYELTCPAGSSGAGFCGSGSNSSSSSSTSASASATTSVGSAIPPSSTAATSTVSDLETMPTVVVPPTDTSVTNLETFPTFTDSDQATATATGSGYVPPPPPYPTTSGAGSASVPYPTGSGPTETVAPTGTGVGSATSSYSGPAYTGAANKASMAGAGLLAIAGLAAAL